MAYVDGKTKRVYRTGTHDKRETLSIMQKLEDDHRQISLGYREPPKPCERHKDRSYLEIALEYIMWGEAQGGRKGYPWSYGHANRMRAMLLREWPKLLDLKIMDDLKGILSGVEKAVQLMKDKGNCGKTINQNVNAMQSFCNWCVERDYLAENPLSKFKPIKAKPTFKRRALTREEMWKIVRIICANPDLFGDWESLFIVACCTGIRENAIKHLTITDLDIERSVLRMNPDTAKNREESFKKINRKLARILIENYESGQVAYLNEKYYSRKDASKQPPKNALVYVPSHPAREIDKLLELAGIEKENSNGKIDFHALRKAYATHVVEAGATMKEAQTALDHSDPRITFNTYADTNDDKMEELADKVTEPMLEMFERAKCVHKTQTESQEKSCKSLSDNEMQPNANGGGGGNRIRSGAA